MTESSKMDWALSVTGPYESTAIVTGPMPRKPNATRPNAKTAGATMIAPSPAVLTMNAVPISTTITMPSQYALKFPATSPDRMPSEAPPSRADVTTSRTWPDAVEVKILTSSGMIAPASVPQVITVESFHQRVPSPKSGISAHDAKYVMSTETIDVSHTSEVSGASKFIRVAAPYLARANTSLRRYDTPLATIMRTRIVKIHTRSCTCTAGSRTASKMNEMRATPVTPYVSKPSALGPTESPALSPVQSAITPGLRASSSLILKTIFIRSEPMSAILVKIPPAMRKAAAPRLSPIAKPMKHGPAYSPGTNNRIKSMMSNSTLIKSMPMLMPAFSGIA